MQTSEMAGKTSSNSIHSSCNLQNFLAMGRGCHESGRCPLRG